MAALNKVLLIGGITQDVEKRVTPNGSSVVNTSLATSEKYNDKSGTQREKTEYHRLVLWNKLADLAESYLKKGSQLYVEGNLQTSEYQDKDGNKRYTTEIVVRSMQFLGGGQGGNHNQDRQTNTAPQPQQQPFVPNQPANAGFNNNQRQNQRNDFLEDD